MDAKSAWLIVVHIILISLNSYTLGRKTYIDRSCSWFNRIVIILLYASIFSRLIWKVH